VRRSPKSSQLQIRVSADEKSAIKLAASRAGLDLSAYVLSRVLPLSSAEFAIRINACVGATQQSFVFAELNSLLSNCTAGELRETVATPPPSGLTPFLANYVAAIVEHACVMRGVATPTWTRSIASLTEPVFASELQSLRLHVLTQSPPPFRNRNLFIGSSLGARFETATPTQTDPRGLFELLSEELRRSGIHGELFLVGGAVMHLAYASRPSAQDVDGVFRAPILVREAAARAAERAKVKPDWLSGAVKAFLTAPGDTAPIFLEFEHLRVMVAKPEYLLAMKCLAMKSDAIFHDEDDVRFLLRLLEIRSVADAVTVINRYFPMDRFAQGTLSALPALLPKATLP
jgi:uncharacterized protein (DUF1778 family)